MVNQTETVQVNDGATCQISVSNSTNFFNKWDNDPIWWVNYTVYHGNNTTFPIISGNSGIEESIGFQRIPVCYFDKLSRSINISSSYTATDPNTQALNWLIDDESAFSSCTDGFLVERFALSAVNFAAPINSNNDDDDDDSSLWISVEQQCRWENIACNEGSVETLAVRSKDLTGTIPTAVGLLTGLRRMDYADNNGLSGTIPSEIGLLTNLKGLDIDNNKLTGTIPRHLGQLVNMIELDLDKNELTGTIPTEFGYMRNAREFDLIYNKLSGPIPTEIGQLKNMATLGFVGNQLTGTIPTEIGTMPNLEGLQIAENAITGSLPREIQFTKATLKDLFVSQNMMTGSIPREIGRLTLLEKLQLDNNAFTGTLPSEIGLMTSLSYINLRGNNFRGTIPSQIGLLTNLKEIWLDGNDISGSLPLEISVGLKGLVTLALDDTISGTVQIRGDVKTLDRCTLCNGNQNYDIKSERNNDDMAYSEKAPYGTGVDKFSCKGLLAIKNDPNKLMSGDGCQALRECVVCGSGNFRDELIPLRRTDNSDNGGYDDDKLVTIQFHEVGVR
eukprot:jgi/Psemu1/229999/e_gw1.2939.3.1